MDRLSINKPTTILNLKIPNKTRSDLTPEFILKRIPEIIGTEKYREFQENYYKYIYTWFMTEVGFPIRDVYTERVPHDELSIGDVIVIEEVGNYSRLYQRVPNHNGFLILEQFADRVSNKEMVIWNTQIRRIPNPIENVGEYEDLGHIIYNLNDLETNETYLCGYFRNYLNNQKAYYIDNLLNTLPQDKAEVIRKFNPDWEGMVEKLWADFIDYVKIL